MNYVNGMEAKACNEAEIARTEASLTDTLRETSSLASDLLGMSRRINEHLFGGMNTASEKNNEPKCFRDELEKVKCNLLGTAKELNEMCCRLGL